MIKLKFKILSVIFVLISFSAYFGCSENTFTALPNPKCVDLNNTYGEGTCVETNDGYQISGNHDAGKADILFVVDNSGSMYVQQQKMAERFNNLYSKISGLDFRIAVITTDVSYSPSNSEEKPGNSYGTLQDGKFLKFSNGKDILSKTDCPENDANCLNSLFSSVIQREETLGCNTQDQDKWLKNCPSSDERAIFAINLALDRGHSDFFRKDASLHFVILSDEDERSSGGEATNNSDPLPIETYDLPETLVEKVNKLLGPLKTFSVHSIIIPPLYTAPNSYIENDYKECFRIQNSEGDGIKGFYGDYYAQLSKPSEELKKLGNINNGHIGMICLDDYAYEMGEIGSRAEAFQVQLVCSPKSGTFKFELDPSPGLSYNYNVDENNVLTITPNPGPGYKLRWTYLCESNF